MKKDHATNNIEKEKYKKCSILLPGLATAPCSMLCSSQCTRPCLILSPELKSNNKLTILSNL